MFGLFDTSHTIAAPLFCGREHPWEILADIHDFILETGVTLDDSYSRCGDIWIARDAAVSPTASITGPCIIDHGAEIRHCAFIRGSVIVGRGCVAGNSTEIKNSILFDGAQAPHFNYVGDSIMGFRSHMGAGVITSNLRSDRKNVISQGVATGMRKLGAMIGDRAEIGCGAVLCPGSIVGRDSIVYPCCAVRGSVPEGHIYKAHGITAFREV